MKLHNAYWASREGVIFNKTLNQTKMDIIKKVLRGVLFYGKNVCRHEYILQKKLA